MYIDKIVIENFRCFAHKEIHFHPQFNVLIGENGIGKTAVMDAIAYLLKAVSPYLSPGDQLDFTKNDFRRTRFGRIEEVSVSDTSLGILMKKILIKKSVNENRGELGWDIKQNLQHPYSEKIYKEAIKTTQEMDISGVEQPIIAYYRSDRVAPKTSKIEKEQLVPNDSRFSAYNNALAHNPIDVQMLTARLKTLDMEEFKLRKDAEDNPSLISELKSVSAELNLIKQAIINCIPNCKKIDISYQWNELVMDIEGAEPRQPFSLLSEGFRNMLAIVGDIAYRCVKLNPDLAENCLTETDGIVMIDEIDLHLHPNWQKNIVGALKQTFPKIQFIVTTHSPFIVQSDVDRLIDLSKDRFIDSEELSDLSLNEIAHEIMGVESVYSNKNHQKEIQSENYLVLLEKAEKDLAHKSQYIHELEAQENAISDPGLRALLRMERIAKNII